ncbi:hypothetical protein G3N95_33825 [Paraburkholderia sp. Tr-20389]|uniref:hypothetical protein n=1 Tax=Paraburkholderia sp. Tr-20389 TaxID=2703903 RepID=UPI0019803150|nr:hypothetical protein [Paraburkholderia sp. Tr-20389]MBN3757938.1 hypothetical protein [Paraburkholderia sp. Tr-20389]
MRSEQYDYNDDQTPLPSPCYDGLCSPSAHEKNTQRKRTAAGMLTFGIAWLFGLEALLSDDEN